VLLQCHASESHGNMTILKSKLKVVLFTGLVLFGIISVGHARNYRVVSAKPSQDKLKELNEQILQYEAEVGRLQEESNTLSNQIAQYDAQINLAELRINQTYEKIANLGSRIDELEVSLGALTKAFSERAEQTYKLARLNKPYLLLLSANDLPNTVSNFHYLSRIQEADSDLLARLEEAQGKYRVEKSDQEDLQIELEKQQSQLERQKTAKNTLLLVTKNDEKRYQSLLSKARAEIVAIQSIIAGKGEETEVGPVGTGERVASIIPGASSCSDGGHVHFEIAKDGAYSNPASFLSQKEITWNNAPDGPFDFTGSWSWPLNDPIRITQGYGMTHYANSGYYGGKPHTGIDMTNRNDYTVKAVRPGKLFQGAISCRGGALQYVRVEHDDGYSSYYLHVNY